MNEYMPKHAAPACSCSHRMRAWWNEAPLRCFCRRTHACLRAAAAVSHQPGAASPPSHCGPAPQRRTPSTPRRARAAAPASSLPPSRCRSMRTRSSRCGPPDCFWKADLQCLPVAAVQLLCRASPLACLPRTPARPTCPSTLPSTAAAVIAAQAGALQHLEAFASFNGPDFYGLPRNTGAPAASAVHALAGVLASCCQRRPPASPAAKEGACPQSCSAAKPAPRMACLVHASLLPAPLPSPSSADKVTLRRQPWTVPASYAFGDSEVVPMWAGQECPWTVVSQ